MTPPLSLPLTLPTFPPRLPIHKLLSSHIHIFQFKMYPFNFVTTASNNCGIAGGNPEHTQKPHEAGAQNVRPIISALRDGVSWIWGGQNFQNSQAMRSSIERNDATTTPTTSM